MVASAGLLGGYWSYERTRQIHHSEVELKFAAEAKLKLFQEWIEEKHRTIGSQVDYLAASASLDAWQQAGQPEDFAPLIQSLALLRAAGDFYDVRLWNPRTGEVTGLASRAMKSRDFEIGWTQVQGGAAVILGDFIDEVDREILIPFYAKVPSEGQNDEDWLLVTLVDPAEIIFPILAERAHPTDSGEFLLVADTVAGVRIVSPDRKSTAANVKHSDRHLPAVMALSGSSGPVVGVDYDGQEVVAYVGKIPNSPWWLVAKQDRAEVMAAVHRNVRVVAMLLVILLLCGAVMLIVLFWREARERYQHKIQATKVEERRFRDAIYGAPVPAMMVAEDGEIFEVNRAWAESSGHDVTRMVTIHDWIERAFPDDPGQARGHFDTIFSDAAGEGRFECEPQTPEGEKRAWVCGSAVTGQLPDGRRVATTFATDVTAQRKAAAESRDTYELINAMFLHASIGLISYRADGSAVVANPAAARITGGTVEHLQASNFNTIHSWKESGLWNAAQRALADNQTVEIDTEFETTYGRRVALVGAMVPFARAGERWLLFAFHDEIKERLAIAELEQLLESQRELTETVQAEVTMHKETISKHRLLQSALEAVPSGVVITDPLGKVEWANPGFTRLTGYAANDVVGHSTNILRSGRQDDGFYRKLWETISSGEVWAGDLENRRKDGSIYWESMVIAPILSESRSITHYVAIKRDITERRLLEDQLTRAQRMESIGLLAGGLSHDLNNVLSPIMMGLELFKMRSTEPKDIARLDMLLNSAERGAGIVRQMLTFARGVDGERAPLNPLSFLKEISKFLDETIPPSIKIELVLPESIGRVMADVTQLHQVLINLSVNARDAMPQGGVLRLKVKETITNQDIMTRSGLVVQPGHYIEFEVSDTGMGIPKEILDRIFDPFFTTKPRGRGTGLGLSSVHGIVRGHGGAIDVFTETGKGTRFLIYLPICEQDISHPPFAALASIVEGRGRVILVVDDEEPVRMVMSMTLEDRGFVVDQAEDGRVAVALFVQDPDRYAAVVLDYLMPEMDGAQVAVRIKELRPQMPIILSSGVLSGGGELDDNSVIYHRLGDFEMRKPFSASRLLSMVSLAVGDRSQSELG